MNTESILHKTLTSSGGVSPPLAGATQQAGAETAPLQRQRWLTMATSAVDRAGDVLVMEGIEYDNFLKNPQFLWQHGSSGAVVNTIGKVLDVQIASGTLYALVEYDTSELAQNIFELSERGLLPANSIGFRPLEWHANDFGGNTFTKWELIECSKVELPMNPEAVDSAKAYSIEDAAEWLCAI